MGLILIGVWYGCVVLGQDALKNEAKYWVWRDRLVNDFMVPNYTGDTAHAGRGIVFNERLGIGWHRDLDTFSWKITNYYGGFSINDEGFELGKYLLVLATEWRLLYKSGLPTQQVEAEIYWALKTVDRLDYKAEYYWSYFWNRGQRRDGVELNGFMIRDDVFTSFLWYDANYPTPENNLDTGYFNFFKNKYSLSSVSDVPSCLKFTSDAYENYRYLNQGYGGNRGKYVNYNVMLMDDDNNIYSLVKLMEKKRTSRGKGLYPVDGGFSAAMAGLYSCFDDKDEDYKYDRVYYNFDTTFNFDRSEFREGHWTGPGEYSQDNYIGLLQGLVGVRKFVNSDVEVNGILLSNYAKGQVKRSSYSNSWRNGNLRAPKSVGGVEWGKGIGDVMGEGQYHEQHLKDLCDEGVQQEFFLDSLRGKVVQREKIMLL